ncbi:MAG TPA: Ig-like domain-containing protein [Verrucomicrobiae bacterium]|nr:Ig-like domain-containing protein [Verrucomicrobiae bacterium]
MDVVTIQATVPAAVPPDHPGVFTIARQGETNYSLIVFYHIGGTASNGVDYAQIPGAVTIAAGSRTASIFIQPETNSLSTADKTVELQLVPSPLECPSPECGYDIGSPSNAVVVIHFSATNAPPYVQLNSPSDGATFTAPATIGLRAYAVDLEDGFNLKVEFFAGTNSLGFGVFVPTMCPSPYCPFFALTWSNAPPGAYVLTAKATDTDGVSSVSGPVHILVTQSSSNAPPVVRITSPPNGAEFFAPLDIPLFAYAYDVGGSVTSVEFFDGANSLGLGHLLSLPVLTNLSTTGLSPVALSDLFLLVWSNPPPGMHALTARAADNGGASTVSDVVNITVLPAPPPPTNTPPIVNIVATDPVAIEGTNCWPWLGLAPASISCWSNWAAAFPPWHIYTNCGPKNAIFTVHRHGATNHDLTVSYAIGGTATNGIDYVALPGSVTIPAGERSALIVVVPVDDGSPDLSSTVVFKLLPSASLPPDYLLGYPPSAAALILDGPSPRPLTGVLADKCFHLAATGPDGAWFHIEYSTDLQHWSSICTNQVVQGSIDFIDPDAPADGQRFYRAVPETTTPASN